MHVLQLKNEDMIDDTIYDKLLHFSSLEASVVEFCALDGWKRDLIRLLSSTVEYIDRILRQVKPKRDSRPP